MKKRLLWSIVGAGIIVATLLWWRLSDRGPRYQGKSISYWLRSSGGEQAKAFRAMGTNAIPYLVAQVKKEDSWWAGFYSRTYPRLPLWLRSRLRWPQFPRARQSQALSWLVGMGWDARATTPDLIRVYRRNRAKPPSSAATAIAGSTATPLAKVMASTYASSDLKWRGDLINGLIFIGGDDPELIPTVLSDFRLRAALIASGQQQLFYPPTLAVSTNLIPAVRKSVAALLTSVDDQAPEVRLFAVNALGLVLSEKDEVTQPLIRALKDPNFYVRAAALRSFGGAQNPSIINMLAEALRDTNALVRAGAAAALGSIGPKAKTAVPILVELADQSREPDPQVRRNAAEALWTIDRQAYAVIPYRIAMLDDNSDSARWMAASSLEKFGVQSKPAVPALTEMLRKDKNDRLRAKAASALGEIGPAASPAIPALQEALKDEYSDVQNAAKEALKKINAKP